MAGIKLKIIQYYFKKGARICFMKAKNIKKVLLTALCSIIGFFLLSKSQIVSSSVKDGISLVLYAVIPALMPFMLLINFMLKYNLSHYISYLFHPILHKLFRTSPSGTFAVIIGFTCGFPMGAKTIGDLYRLSKISSAEACYLITFCNNCSVSFLINYIVCDCLKGRFSTPLTLIFVYLPPIMTGLINRLLLFNTPLWRGISNEKPTGFLNTVNLAAKKYEASNYFINPIADTLKSLANLSVYVICFMIVSQLIQTVLNLPDIIKSVLICFGEITSGAHYIAQAYTPGSFSSFFILSGCVLGGASILFQSFSFLPTKKMKWLYMIGKLEQLMIFMMMHAIFYVK